MISLSGVAKAHGAAPLFRGVSLQLLPGRRVALVGSNGTGKTTLLEIALGLQTPDSGDVSRARDVRVGYLPQDLVDTATGTVLEETLAGAEEVLAVERRMHELHDRLEDEAALAEYGHLQDRYTQLGGYELEAEAQRVLAGLGFAPDAGDRPVTELSGGWRVRVALARLLLSRPDVLVLDEPTNHLDLDSIRWLEQSLAAWSGAILFVSHDRYFIDAVAERIVELSAGTAVEYVVRRDLPIGAFDQFVAQREERLAGLRAARATQDRQIAQQERFIERFRYKATKARQVQSRVKALDRLDRVDVPDDAPTRVRFGFPTPPRSGRVVVELSDVAVGYDTGADVLRGVDVVVERGRTVGIIGPNGAGKSTLLHLLTGRLAPRTGTATLGHNVEVATFAQHQVDALDLDRTVIEEFSRVLGDDHRGINVRTMLGSFGFPGELADRVVAELSGGERTRLALARVMANPVNLLVLDEPTNHLDIPSRDVLVDALVDYPGTALVVTHDRHVIRSVADMVLEVRDGRVVVHDGTYEELLARRPGSGTSASTATSSAPAGSSGGVRPDADPEVDARRREVELRRALQSTTAPLRREVQRLEAEVGRMEGAVAELARRLADPAAYEDPTRARDLAAAHDRAKDRADELMGTWEQRLGELEAAEARVRASFS